MASFRAGTARASITPWLRPGYAQWRDADARHDIHDELYAKAIVLENDSTSIAIVVCDLGELLEEDMLQAKHLAARLTGIPESHIFISCTHIHSGPATLGALGSQQDSIYMSTVAERIATAVVLAQNRLRPAEAGWASTSVPNETFNRRIRLRDGTIRNNFALSYQDPRAVEPAGPIDPELALLVLREPGGDPIALLASYSLHYMGALGDPGPAYSADYFGYFDRALQRLAGRELVGIMANACSGDANQIDIWHPKDELPHFWYQAERVANVLAGAAYSAWQGLRRFEYDSDPVLAAHTERAIWQRRQPTQGQLERARALLAGKAALDGEPRLRPWEFPQWELVYAEEILLLDKEPLQQSHPVMAMRVGDLAIFGLPGEAFVEYGLDVKARSPFKHTMAIELANGYSTYLASNRALSQASEDDNSYDTHMARSSCATPGTQSAFVEAALRALQAVASR